MAGEWTNCIFQGKLKIVARGKTCYVLLLTQDDQPFCTCPVDPSNIERSIERALDSSRYFVIKIVGPQGQHAFIGMGFDERNDAFDFYATLLDFADRENQENQVKQEKEEQKAQDLSHLRLQEGQTLSLGRSGDAPLPKPAGGPLFRLPKPPS